MGIIGLMGHMACRLTPPSLCYGTAWPEVFAWDRREKAPSRRTLPAQSMTMWAILNHGRDQTLCDSGLQWEPRKRPRHRISGSLSGRARMSAVQPAERERIGNCSLISTCFHLIPLVSAVLIIKIFSKQALGHRASSAGLGAEWAGFHGS